MSDAPDVRSHGRSTPAPMRLPTCRCGADGVRDERYDAYYCPESGVWLEEGCSDSTCGFCVRRPERCQLDGGADGG